jgi:lysophospholipase L1-like esterase
MSYPRPSAILLLLCMAVGADAAVGQSLSIVRRGENELWIEATAPPDTRYELQASGDLRDWVAINDEVWGQWSYRLDDAGISKRFFRLTAWTPPPPPIILMLIGESTVADLANNNNWYAGWGQGIPGYLNSDVRVVNLAYPCVSTSMFLASAEKTKMLVVKPDFVLVQFGLLDWLGCNGQHKTTLQEYADNLRSIVQLIRGFNGTPILITSPVGRYFDDQGKVLIVMEDRRAVVREVAAELQTHLIDLGRLSLELYNELGDSASAYISCDRDRVHFSIEGARVIAGLVVNAFPDSLRAYVVSNVNPPPDP